MLAMVEGSVWGGACELVFACDLIVTAPSACFAVTPARLGVPYSVSGMLTFMNACSLRIAKEMAFTAKPMSAERAERLGIVNHNVSADQFKSFTYDLARQIAENAPLAVSVMKEQLRMLSGAHAMSPRRFERVQGLRRVVYDSDDYAEGIRAFREKRGRSSSAISTAIAHPLPGTGLNSRVKKAHRHASQRTEGEGKGQRSGSAGLKTAETPPQSASFFSVSLKEVSNSRSYLRPSLHVASSTSK